MKGSWMQALSLATMLVVPNVVWSLRLSHSRMEVMCGGLWGWYCWCCGQCLRHNLFLQLEVFFMIMLSGSGNQKPCCLLSIKSQSDALGSFSPCASPVCFPMHSMGLLHPSPGQNCGFISNSQNIFLHWVRQWCKSRLLLQDVQHHAGELQNEHFYMTYICSQSLWAGRKLKLQLSGLFWTFRKCSCSG